MAEKKCLTTRLPVIADSPLSPQQMEAEESLFNSLAYLTATEIDVVRSAYLFSHIVHSGQFRESGEPYICHPLSVAATLAQWHMDEQTLCAALLHDVIEDTDTTAGDIALRFGEPVAQLVSGVSKLDRIDSQTLEEAQAENFRKMILAMASDVRVILIKLADRLHNMKTLSAVNSEKRKRVARETLEIYVPIAHRLGLNDLYIALRELAFTNMYPMRSSILKKAIEVAQGAQRKAVLNIQLAIRDAFSKHGIRGTVYGREKHIFSIYQKMLEKNLSFSQINDIFGFRILLDQVLDCYVVLGILHKLYKPMPGTFKDYISIPKINGYQSLHTTLISPQGLPIEIQIRTHEMHHIAESGVAAHWLYKSGQHPSTEAQRETYLWLQSLLDLQNTTRDATDFFEYVKIDLFPEDIFVFTPKGHIKSLPVGALVIDFAYAIHSDIGHCCVGARVNGIPVPISTELRNGDQVDIIVGERPNPKDSWIKIVRTGRARLAIRHFLKTTQRQSSVELGERLLAQAFATIGAASDLNNEQWECLLKLTACKDRHELLAEIGSGKRLAMLVARQALETREQPNEQIEPVIVGTEGLATRFASCCYPIPGDPIMGVFFVEHGLSVHRLECAGIRRYQSGWIHVVWGHNNALQAFPVAMSVTVNNVRGILGQVCSQIALSDADIQTLSFEDEYSDLTKINFVLSVADRQQLARVFKRVRRLSKVVKISRK